MFSTNARYDLPRKIAGGIISPRMTRRQARTALQNAGWAHLDGGSYSSAWVSPCGTRIAKVSKPDRGAEAVCEAYCRAKRNRTLPKYFGRIELDDGGFVYEVERLTELDFDAYDDFRAALSEASDCSPWGGGEAKNCNARAAARKAAAILQSMIDEVGTAKLDWDCHRGNVRMRGDVCVMIDPLYDPSSLGAAIKGTAGCETENGLAEATN